MEFWQVTREWAGQKCWIVAGGPSVATQDLAPLRGRNVIAINNAFTLLPEASFLIWSDIRWWRTHQAAVEATFRGRVVAISRLGDGRLLRLKRIATSAAAPLRAACDEAAVDRTTLTGALNLAKHLGASVVTLVGADMQRAPDGRTHFHAGHEWQNKPGNASWDAQLPQLRACAAPLAAAGMKIFNASPRSRVDWWPSVTLEASLCD